MPFDFRELDATVRGLMVKEIEDAIATETLFFCERFNDTGTRLWPGLLLQSAREGNEHQLARQLEALRTMKGFERRRKPKGGYKLARVPHTAAKTLADAEFNRYYMCAVCRKALAEGKKTVTVYRARTRSKPRTQSQSLIGTTRDAAQLLAELRQHPPDKAHPLLQPNSGLSVYS